MVEEDDEFRKGVRRGIAQAGRGDLMEHGEVKERIARLMRSR